MAWVDMVETIEFQKNKLNLLEKYVILIGFTMCYVTGLIIYYFVFYRNASINFFIYNVFLLLFALIIIFPIYYSYRKYCTFPDYIGFSKDKIIFKNGNNQNIIQINNIDKINIYWKKTIEIKLKNPKTSYSFRLSPILIDRIENIIQNKK
jgi:hypothetical protein